MSKSDKSVHIISEVIETVKIIGPEKTVQAIVDARRHNSEILNKKIQELIWKHTAKEFGMSEEKLKNSRSKGERTDALMVAYALTKKHLDYTLSDIAKMFDKDQSGISKAITTFNRLDSGKKNEKHIIDIYSRINVTIIDFVKQNTWDQSEEAKA